jgi:hypothetical protein
MAVGRRGAGHRSSYPNVTHGTPSCLGFKHGMSDNGRTPRVFRGRRLLLELAMTAYLFLALVVVIAALAPLLGADSRELTPRLPLQAPRD